MTIQFASEIRALPESERRAAYDKFIVEDNRPDNLELRISAGVALTETEIGHLLDLFGKHCQHRTKANLARAFRVVPDLPSYGTYERILIHPDRASYAAGQDYTAELPRVRRLLTTGRSD